MHELKVSLCAVCQGKPLRRRRKRMANEYEETGTNVVLLFPLQALQLRIEKQIY